MFHLSAIGMMCTNRFNFIFVFTAIAPSAPGDYYLLRFGHRESIDNIGLENDKFRIRSLCTQLTFRRKLINLRLITINLVWRWFRLSSKTPSKEEKRNDFAKFLESTKTKETEEAATAADEAKRDERGKSVTFTIHHKRWSKEEMRVAKAKGATERKSRGESTTKNDMQWNAP